MSEAASGGEGRRYILYHKHHASARTRFLCLNRQSVLYPLPLPELSQRCDESMAPATVVEAHPAMLLQQLALSLSCNADELELEPEYEERVDVAGSLVRIYLVAFTTIDPPFELAERHVGSFIDLTQARALPETELLLLRRAYEVIMEG